MMSGEHGPLGLRCTISGSMRKHLPAMAAAARELERQGVSVLSPRSFKRVGEQDDFVLVQGDEGSPEEIQGRHLACMRQADFVWLVCPGGYVGRSAASELEFAQLLGLPVFAAEAPREPTLRKLVEILPLPEALARLQR